MPSNLETFGQPLVEAMAAGAPVLTANLGFSREICGQAACYFRKNSKNDLANKILNLVTNPRKRKALRVSAKKRVKLFSWNKETKMTINLLKKIAEK